MSSHITIRGKLNIINMELAKQAIQECNIKNVTIKNSTFVYIEEYLENHSNANMQKDYLFVENRYKELLSDYYKKIEAEKQRILDLKIEEERLNEILRLEKIKEEENIRKKIAREEKLKVIKENALKCGYTVKKTVNKNNKIQLVLCKRVY